MHAIFRACLVAGALLPAFAPTVSAQTREARALSVQEAPVVDGRLTEADWTRAPVLTDFIQRIPNDGQVQSPASHGQQ